MYVFWRKTTDPPSPWTRLTRTNEYLRFNSSTANHWTQTGSTTHTHPSASVNVGDSVHSGEEGGHTGTPRDSVMGSHNNHPVTGYSIANSNNNNPIGWGLDIIYIDITTWENSIRSFPEGAIIMSSGTLVDASLERYSSADGKYIVHLAARDLADNQGTESIDEFQVTVDNTPPEGEIRGIRYDSQDIEGYFITNDNTPKLFGTCIDTNIDTVKLTIDKDT